MSAELLKALAKASKKAAAPQKSSLFDIDRVKSVAQPFRPARVSGKPTAPSGVKKEATVGPFLASQFLIAAQLGNRASGIPAPAKKKEVVRILLLFQ